MRKKRPLKRTLDLKRDASLVVIASEDRYAPKQYFALFHSTRIQFRVLETENGNSSPEHVIDRLDKYKDEYQIGEGDQFWLVCDTDHWINHQHIKNLVGVIRRCRQKGIGVALSNPCFDLWLLLHFTDFHSQTPIDCKKIGQLIRSAVGGYNKTRIYNLPFSNDSVHRALSRAKKSFSTSSEIPRVPQTAVFQILDDLVERGLVSISEN